MRICAQCQSAVTWSKDYCPLCSAPVAPEEQKMEQPMELKAQIQTQNLNHSATPPPKLTVGSVLKQTCATLRRNPAVFFGLGLISTVSVTLTNIIKETLGENPAGIFLILSLILMMLTNAAFAYAAVQTLRGNTVTFGESLSRGASKFLTLIFASFLLLLICLVTLILSGLIAWVCTFVSKLIIGTVPLGRSFSLFPLLTAIISFILFIVLFISMILLAPACVVEGLGAVQSIKRSAALTQNYRLKIFGIFMVATLIFGTIGGILGFIGGILDAMLFSYAKIIGIPLESLTFLLSTTFSGVMFPIIYCKVREIKEGTAIESLARVFD